jgi:plasmid stability protein
MGVMIQIRNVPPDLHRELKSRAALAGMSLSDYLLREIRQVAERPTIEQMRARLAALPPVELVPSPAVAIREERDRR